MDNDYVDNYDDETMKDEMKISSERGEEKKRKKKKIKDRSYYIMFVSKFDE